MLCVSSLYFTAILPYFSIDYRLFQILFFFSTDPFCSVWCLNCGEVWTLGVWGELACNKMLFNPLPQLGTWCPAFVCVYMYVCVCVCVCMFGGLS